VIVDIGASEEFQPGRPRVFIIEGREVMVVHWGEEWFGLRNVCPHQTEMLANGVVHEEIGAGACVGEYRLTGRPLIACPRHVWTYDLRTGQCTVDPQLRVRAYRVSVSDGRVLVDDGGPEVPATARERASAST
jgi:3-phenylpropionate/trans-cinnamate dioxygenase ferredoxin subunit